MEAIHEKYPAELEVLGQRIQESLSIVQQMLGLSKNPYIALSFGKDSLVMMDLVYRLSPGVKCLFLKSEESFLMYNYEELIEWYQKNRQLNLHIVKTQRLSEHNFDWNRARKAGNQDFYLDGFFDGYDGIFMGLRMEESPPRMVTLAAKEHNRIGKFIMQYQAGKRKGMYRCCPVAEWTSFEIMFYLQKCKLPMLDVYRLGDHIRTTARITGTSVRRHTLFWIKKNKPENWNRIVQILPELRSLMEI